MSAVTVLILVCVGCGGSGNEPDPLPGHGITAVSPTSGSAAGGTAVTITGHGFLANTTVRFGSAPAASLQLVNATTVTAVTPPHAAGVVDVVVGIGGSNTSLTGAFTFTN